MPDIVLQIAEAVDIEFVTRTQRLEAVSAFVGAASEQAVAEAIVDPNQAILIGMNASGESVAFAHLCDVKSPHRSIELRQLATAVPKKGFGGMLLRLVMAEAFQTYGANRLWLDVFPENTVARNLYRRCGFVEEGTLRDAYFWKGKFQSTIVMSLLAGEYDTAILRDARR